MADLPPDIPVTVPVVPAPAPPAASPWKALAQSRKTIVSVASLVVSGAVVLGGLFTNADPKLVMTYVAAVSAIAYKLIGAIATEDAAKSDAQAQIAVATANALNSSGAK